MFRKHLIRKYSKEIKEDRPYLTRQENQYLAKSMYNKRVRRYEILVIAWTIGFILIMSALGILPIFDYIFDSKVLTNRHGKPRSLRDTTDNVLGEQWESDQEYRRRMSPYGE